jgi:hypothetical protein
MTSYSTKVVMRRQIDAPPNFLKDSNVNLKVKTTEEEKVGIRSLVCSTPRIKGTCWSSKMGSKMSDKQVN